MGSNPVAVTCKPNILKLEHQNHWKNTENRKNIHKSTQNILQQSKRVKYYSQQNILEKYSAHFLSKS